MTTADGSESGASLRPYLLQYALAYLVISVGAKSVLQVLNLGTNPGIDIGLLVAALVVPILRFVRDNGRPFSAAEQLRFALVAFLASLLISLALGSLAALIVVGSAQLPASISELTLQSRGHFLLFMAALAISCLVSFAALYFASGFLARAFGKRLAPHAASEGEA
jgi:hypothetical protein